jgi:hypothetical protein
MIVIGVIDLAPFLRSPILHENCIGLRFRSPSTCIRQVSSEVLFQ